MYCCQSASGGKICGDGLPEQCRGKAYKILSSSGAVIKEVGPPLTAEQKAQAEADAKRKKEEEAARQEQRRKDSALLATYSSVKDVDQARTRAETNILELIKQSEAKIEALKKQRKKYDEEAEFYKKKALPPELEKNLRYNDSEINSYNGIIEGKKAELEKIRTKYDEDKRRFLELSGGGQQASRQ